MLSLIINQEKPVSRLLTMFIKNTVPHALLFTGIEGIGKNAVALALAMAFNCENRFETKLNPIPPNDFSDLVCLKCASCKKILSSNHPDIIQINPSGKMIKIAQIRDLCSTLLVKPFEAEKRVVIINKSETMNQEAGNALLKVLEEPPDNTLFILISGQSSDLLPTILSRCQHIGFNPVSSENIEVYLKKNCKVEPETAEIVASMANGSIKKAVEIAGNGKKQRQWLTKRLWIIDEFNSLNSRNTGACLLFAEKLATQKESVADLLDILLNYVRDLIIFRFSPEKIINRDLTEKIADFSKKISVKSLLSITDHLQSAQKDIKSNASLRLTLELMVMKITRV